MGTTAQIVLVGDVSETDLDWGQNWVEQSEQCLSRFRPDSELSRLNQLAGFPTVVSEQLFHFLSAASQAAALTDGLFDPTLGRPAVANGYDQAFGHINNAGGQHSIQSQETSVRLDQKTHSVWTDPCTQFDLGGIAKGLCADDLSLWLLERGASGCCVNIGGDLRVRGQGPEPDLSWMVHLEHPSRTSQPATPGTVALREGAVCTSSTLKRCWTSSGERRNHLIDPQTRRSADSDLCSLSVLSHSAATAEVLATAGIIAGASDAKRRILAAGACAVATSTQGQLFAIGDVSAFGNSVPAGNPVSARNPVSASPLHG